MTALTNNERRTIENAATIFEKFVETIGDSGVYASRLAVVAKELRAVADVHPAPGGRCLPGEWGEVRAALGVWRAEQD